MNAGRARAPDDVVVHLRRARDHADAHYAEDLDLGQLAAVAGLSKYHFHRLFAVTYGCTPAAYVSERRIERAQDLLRGDQPHRHRGLPRGRLLEPGLVQQHVPPRGG